MENIVNKIKSYAKANGINEINFQSDVKIVKPSDENIKIDTWNLSIAEPTLEQLNALETEATAIETAEANEVQAKINLKASAKAKLIAGEALTEDEANTIVL